MTTIIGIDAATQPKKLGLARGRLDGATVIIEETVRGSEVSSTLDTLCDWVCGPTLFAIDAPLGWPTPLRESLTQHRAGECIHTESNDLFRRTTDRFVHATLGKLPLDVGADRIARTAHAALRLLGELRTKLECDVPLSWSPVAGHGLSTIEVYPAATLISRGINTSGYKGAKPEAIPFRRELLNELTPHWTLRVPEEDLAVSDDHLDAALCVLAGADFLRGLSVAPTSEQADRAREEGWIWFRGRPGAGLRVSSDPADVTR